MTTGAHTDYHLRPASGGWLNDPNGMTRVGDVWHVFYQHNPAGPWHEAIAWGHATSRDLATWTHHPIAFSPTPGGPDEFGCWSGCFVPGGEHPTVAYSAIADASHRSTVCLRYGSDDLLTWGDPVVVAGTPEADDIAVMRDPFVFDVGGRRWAILGAGLRDGSPAVLLFNRDHETAWTYEGLFATSADPAFAAADPADIWECPQLVRVDGRWVLILSLQHRGVLGRVVAVVGDVELVDGLPRFTGERLNVLDNGNDFYAPQVTEADGRPLLLGWVRQADQDPAVADHAGCMTLPRRLSLRDGVVTSAVDPCAAGALLHGSRPFTGTSLEGLHAWLVVDGQGANLVNDRFGTVAVGSGAEIWVDGPVLELYPRGGVPSVWRGDAGWRLDATDGARVSISEVAPSTP
ncbi:glycoside hydrolase family 32 protein [Tessaracoccus sp. G1721]